MAQIEGSKVNSRDRVMLAVRQRPLLGIAIALALGLLAGAGLFGASQAKEAWDASSGIEVERGGEPAARHDGPEDGLDDGGDSGDPDADGAPKRGGAETTEEPLVVDVAGSVVNPGVVELEPGSRVRDAIDAAGGLAGDADASSVNRAAKVTDGQQVYIPREGEAVPPGATSPAGAAGSPGGAASSALVNINTAGLAELDELPGVGPATAQAILDDREANGPFMAPEDLMRVSGIGEKKFEKLKTAICV